MATRPSLFDPRGATRLFTAAHEFWYRLTGGLVGGWAGAPILLLTTKGRKTGAMHTTPLLFLRDGEDLVVIASYGGSDRDPQWWRNLQAEPQAEVQVFSNTTSVLASAAQGDERTRLWERITRSYPIYRFYENRTERQIPVVVLKPVKGRTEVAAPRRSP